MSRVQYHNQKLTFIIVPMRYFANELPFDGWRVRYVQLGDPANSRSIVREIERAKTPG